MLPRSANCRERDTEELARCPTRIPKLRAPITVNTAVSIKTVGIKRAVRKAAPS
jgi:hypothetical protein